MRISQIKIWHIVLLLTFIGGFLRFYNLRGTLQFLGDQGRDALIVRSMLVDKDPVFIGPVTSVGNMYLGPAYYYMMLPFFALTYPSPMGPVYAVALLGTLTIPFLFFVTREMFGNKVGLFATIIFTFSWTFIEYTRFSWNPNPAPFFSLLMIWATYRAWTKHPKYWVLVSFAFSILIQLHYLTLLTLAAAGIIWLFALRAEVLKKKRNLSTFFFATVGAIVLFILSLVPLILFDFRHEFLNARALYDLIFGKEEQIRGVRNLLTVLRETHGRSMQILFEVTVNQLRWLNTVFVIGTAVLLGHVFMKKKNDGEMSKAMIVVVTWLVVGIGGTSLYRSTVFSHYIGFLFPIAAMILGICLDQLWQLRTAVGKAVVLAFFGWFFGANAQSYHLQSLGWTINDMQAVSEQILQRVQPDEKYNIVLLASHGDILGMNYRYFLTASSTPPLLLEHFGEAETLFIINEDHVLKKVTDSPIYEIVVFPDKQPRETFTVRNGPEITVLRK